MAFQIVGGLTSPEFRVLYATIFTIFVVGAVVSTILTISFGM